MTDPQAPLKNLEQSHDWLVAIDSDGCAFGSMEIKHKKCFIPNIIKYWDLQPVAMYARSAAEFVNLYSKWRGINRFPALTIVFDLLGDWPEVVETGAKIPTAQSLRDWIERETTLANPALSAEVEETGDPGLRRVLEWSLAVNATITDMVHGVPPFPHVRRSLEKVAAKADVIVCSATPCEALEREWKESGLAPFVKVIAGQEMGSKKEQLALAIEGRYDKKKVVMIGDAPGDQQAAKANEVTFYPINPGHEAASWQRFGDEVADRFFAGEYDAGLQRELTTEFEALLPSVPPWKPV